jgi:hypothetical protein
MQDNPTDLPKSALDRPLDASDASEYDQLDRMPFAQAVVRALMRVNPSSGLTISIEGPWGSGKTSAMALVEEQLRRHSEPTPIIVHFNPWLVGDRDALLRQFLTRIAEAVRLSDGAESAEKVAKQLTSYAKVFDVVKWIPGAEPFASIVKGVMSSAGHATASIAKEKSANLEARKAKVEKALQRFASPIMVFLDDLDRLLPREVYEMVRILKAVADLPNVGYVIAWDARYIIDALASLNIPQADGFLDKIVQFRMPLPRLGGADKEILVNQALEALPPEALRVYFPASQDRLSTVYVHGLRDLLEHPRDIHRVFNTVRTIEPALRGEVVFADILGLAALMVRCSPVFELLRRHPRRFVDSMPDEAGVFDPHPKVEQHGTGSVEEAIERCTLPVETRALVHHLFPSTGIKGKSFSGQSVHDTRGQLSAPMRLSVALKMSVGSSGVSLRLVRDFLTIPGQRSEIGTRISARNASEFMDRLGHMAQATSGNSIFDPVDLAVAMARLTDTAPFTERATNRGFFIDYLGHSAEDAIVRAVDAIDATKLPAAARAIVEDPDAITMGMIVMQRTFQNDPNAQVSMLRPSAVDENHLRKVLAKNIVAAAQAKQLFLRFDPSAILRGLAWLDPLACGPVFKALKSRDEEIDQLATAILWHRINSSTGTDYSYDHSREVADCFAAPSTWHSVARQRLLDKKVSDDAAAAWLSVLRGVPIYARDFGIAKD